MKVKEVLKNKRGGDGEEWRNGSVRGGIGGSLRKSVKEGVGEGVGRGQRGRVRGVRGGLGEDDRKGLEGDVVWIFRQGVGGGLGGGVGGSRENGFRKV